MKKMKLLLILSLICAGLKAPDYKELVIVRGETVNKYERLIKAIVKVESNNGKYLYNEKEGAVGWFQIRECRLNDFNKNAGKNYTHDEMYHYEKSKEVFLYFTRNRDYETISRAWCSGEAGTKKASEGYWELIQKAL